MEFNSTTLEKRSLEMLKTARQSSNQRHVEQISPRSGSLKQLLLAIVEGAGLSDHANPGQATIQVLSGTVTITTDGHTWQGMAGDYLVIPDMMHDLKAITDATALLTFVKDTSATKHPTEQE